VADVDRVRGWHDFLPVSGLTVLIQPEHLSRIPSPVVTVGAPEAVLELGQALMLAEAPLVGVGAALFGGDRPPQPR